MVHNPIDKNIEMPVVQEKYSNKNTFVPEIIFLVKIASLWTNLTKFKEVLKAAEDTLAKYWEVDLHK